MTHSEAKQFINGYLKQLWPEWDIKREEGQLWCDKLQFFIAADVKEAARTHKASERGSFGSPKLNSILQLLVGKGIGADSKGVTYTGFSQCIDHENPMQKFRFTLWAVIIPNENPNPMDAARRDLVRQCTIVSKSVKGNWVVHMPEFNDEPSIRKLKTRLQKDLFNWRHTEEFIASQPPKKSRIESDADMKTQIKYLKKELGLDDKPNGQIGQF